MKTILKYFTKSESQTIAVWIQTLLLAFGLYYAIVQIDFLAESKEIEMNERYLKYHIQYRDEIIPKVDELFEFYNEITDKKSVSNVSTENLKTIRKKEIALFTFFRDVSTCSSFGLCPESKVDSTICFDAMYLDRQLKRVEPLFLDAKNGSRQIKKASGYYQRWLRTSCSLPAQFDYYFLNGD